MNLINATILGVLEGFTEFLPISSTAHLLIISQWLKLEETEFLKSFIITIQLGAILSVVWLYRKTIFQNREMMSRVLIAFLPTAIVGFILYKLIKGVFFESMAVVAAALFVGGVLMIVFEHFHQAKPANTSVPSIISTKQALLVGCAQALAVVPGVSRAAATIIGGLLLGVGRKEIVEFSFLLAVPTMLAATGYDLVNNTAGFTLTDFHILAAGFVVSFVFALLGVRFLLDTVKKHSFRPYGVYRIALAILIAFWFLF
jgi:undecaprenyl-diphosphatase